MARVRDLTEIINNRPSKTYISAALTDGWQWSRLERSEADALSSKLRQLSSEAKARRYGLSLRSALD